MHCYQAESDSEDEQSLARLVGQLMKDLRVPENMTEEKTKDTLATKAKIHTMGDEKTRMLEEVLAKTKEEKKALRCYAWAKGECKKGDQCEYGHTGTAGPAVMVAVPNLPYDTASIQPGIQRVRMKAL